MKSMLQLEWLQGWRSFRLTGILVLAVVFALMDPPTTKYMAQLLQSFGGGSGFQIIAPQPTPEMAYVSFLGDLAQMGAIVLVLISMGAVAAERERGITAWILATPVQRTQYLLSKFAVYGLGVIIATLAGGAIAYAYTWSLLGLVHPVGAAMALASVGVYLLVITVATLTGSAFLRSQYAAAGVGVASMFIVWLSGVLLGSSALARFLPYGLTAHLEATVAYNVLPADFWSPIIGSLVIVGVLLWAAIARFRRAEV